MTCLNPSAKVGLTRRRQADTLSQTPGHVGLRRRLGELYEARGDRAKAGDYYARLVDLWKDADPELQPIVADARAALKRLRGEPR